MSEKSHRSSRSSTVASTLPPYTEGSNTLSCLPSCFPSSNNAPTNLWENEAKKRSGSPLPPPDAANKPSRGFWRRHNHHPSLPNLKRIVRQKIKSGSAKCRHWKRSIGEALQPDIKALKRVLSITLFLLLTPFCCWISPKTWFHSVGPAAGGCQCIDCQ